MEVCTGKILSDIARLTAAATGTGTTSATHPPSPQQQTSSSALDSKKPYSQAPLQTRTRPSSRATTREPILPYLSTLLYSTLPQYNLTRNKVDAPSAKSPSTRIPPKPCKSANSQHWTTSATAHSTSSTARATQSDTYAGSHAPQGTPIHSCFWAVTSRIIRGYSGRRNTVPFRTLSLMIIIIIHGRL